MDFVITHTWFHVNHMILNLSECYYIMIAGKHLIHIIMLNNTK